MSFDVLVVGSGGGPSEHNLSAYLLKAHDEEWEDGIVGMEAGSGTGALNSILQASPNLLSSTDEGGLRNAHQVYNCVRTFLITHAHLDHITSLVLLAGSLKGKRKSIRGSLQCLKDIDSIFKPNRLWPTLASWDHKDSDHLYLFDPLPEDGSIYVPLHGSLSVRCFPISHGYSYTASAFFIRHDKHGREFLFFGDVEPDSVAGKPLTEAVWDSAAPKIAAGTLESLFIECSWPDGRPDDQLYGHLTPSHLVIELEVLARKVQTCRKNLTASNTPKPSQTTLPVNGRKRQASVDLSNTQWKKPRGKKGKEQNANGLQESLTGLRVYVIHCKEDMDGAYPGRNIAEVISSQVRELVEKRCLGAEVIAAKQGMLIEI